MDFNLEKNTGVLTYEDLDMSIKAVGMNQKPLHGIEHIDLLNTILEGLDKHGYQTKVNEIYVDDRGDSKFKGIQHIPIIGGQDDPKAFQFRRLITSIDIKDISTNDYIASFGVSYTQEGISVGYGPKVKVCSNMSLLNPERVFNTHGKDKSNIKDFSSIINEWAEDANMVREDFSTLENWKSIEVDDAMYKEIIGELELLRVKKNMGIIRNNPLNNGHMTKISESVLKNNYNKELEVIDPITVYELYNLGTENHKGGLTSIPNIINQNFALGSYFKAKFN